MRYLPTLTVLLTDIGTTYHILQVQRHPKMAPTSPRGGGSLLEKQFVTWAAGATAALAIGYVVLGNYLPALPWSSKMDKDAVPGLYNRYGNDCFANCIIQVPKVLKKRH